MKLFKLDLTYIDIDNKKKVNSCPKLIIPKSYFGGRNLQPLPIITTTNTRPVKTNAEHAVVPERCHKQVLVLPSLSKHRQGAVTERDLAHAAPVPDIEDIAL